ncbi:MAG: chromosome segregation protein SMC [Gammaproteobacteria bacterium]|nr:chromosome segregation protein SMC [Gammaproteobacteria bacterium]
MRIKKIKLAGFKSFVDPINIPVEANLIGIVGPNGCGKSNIIDAVRWVMGESSAKQLRGDSMADVIFNGSTARKPVGKASVELIFDNSDGSAPGQFAAFAEVSIKREAGRDGQSDYFLNKTKCRRKDIVDLFLGTGAGPHAYSIIEQGMVTRIIESKPEELRSLFEEAAGVSRYKERRRETENRIKHTRENLARVSDICKELETQLNRLQRQSRAAQRYKELKQEERTVRAQLLSLRWRLIDGDLQRHDAAIASRETELEGVVAGLRAIEAEIERLRVTQIEANDKFNAVQGEYYAAGAEVTNLEQAIQHARETREQHLREQGQLNQSWEEASTHLRADQVRLGELRAGLERSEPLLVEREAGRVRASAALGEAEAAMQSWQSAWESFGNESSEPARVRDVETARIKSLEGQLLLLDTRKTRLSEELRSLEEALRGIDIEGLRREVSGRDADSMSREQVIEQTEAGIRDNRASLETLGSRIEELRGRKQTSEARLASLKELQAAAFGQHDAVLNEWLGQRSLGGAQRLAGQVTAEPGWERAVERILDSDLAAVCVENLDRYSADLGSLNKVDLTFFETGTASSGSSAGRWPTLLSKVRAQVDLAPMLDGIFAAETLEEAMARRGELAPHESIVTRSGAWVGRNWIAITDRESVRAGVLGRERDMEQLTRDATGIDAELESAQAEQAAIQQKIVALEAEREELRRALAEFNRERAAMHARLGHDEARLGQQQARRQQVEHELGEIESQMNRARGDIEGATATLRAAEGKVGTLNERRAQLLGQRDAVRATLEAARATAQAANDSLHQVRIEQETLRTALASTEQGIVRLEGQLRHLTERRTELERLLSEETRPENDLKAQLEASLNRRLEIEARMNTARQAVSEMDGRLREQDAARHAKEQEIDKARETLEHERISRQELSVRRDTLAEQVREGGVEPAQVLAETPSEATEELWHTRLEELVTKIERLGPINLVAIDEYQEQATRKEYLDKQSEDLSQALATLEDAIKKIDRETRTRFKETFDKVNTAFQTIFPKLFGGGHAYLELSGEDILDTGVRVMARPPGKRNSTIHLLSGGEKALTAVSLLFALFELNPAPFCFLDEVDAPLDDANVVRYSDMLKALSQKTQLVYITHNKISMEIAEKLIGVTMSEPGVSRLVAVDVEEALEMVAQQ